MENRSQELSTESAESPRPAQEPRPYWHELPKEKQERVLASKITVGKFMKRYAQPSWCEYPEALAASMGCWSLMIPDEIRKPENCRNCDCLNAKVAATLSAPEREAESEQVTVKG